MLTSIYFVRHALSPFSIDSERERGLSEQGEADARAVAEVLRHESIDAIVSSSYRRAIATVEPLADLLQKPIARYDELAERAIASIKIAIREEELLEAIKHSFEDIDYCMADGETTRAAQERSIPVIEKLLTQHRGQGIAIGTHGNIMTIIMNYYDREIGYDFWLQTSKPDIYKVTFKGLVYQGIERLWHLPD
jgi:2,3-bisphosphoglycerate-dependent phosphoglycerate mutase